MQDSATIYSAILFLGIALKFIFTIGGEEEDIEKD